jgi:hypothetical protein
MLGPRQEAQTALFYDFSIEAHVPSDHVLQAIDGVIDRIAPGLSETINLSKDDGYDKEQNGKSLLA